MTRKVPVKIRALLALNGKCEKKTRIIFAIPISARTTHRVCFGDVGSFLLQSRTRFLPLHRLGIKYGLGMVIFCSTLEERVHLL